MIFCKYELKQLVLWKALNKTWLIAVTIRGQKFHKKFATDEFYAFRYKCILHCTEALSEATYMPRNGAFALEAA